MKFSDFGLKKYVLDALNEINFKSPTEVQEKVIPLALKNETLVVESATGSGKTHSFLIPIFNRIDPNLNTVQAVLIAPTRELAAQLYEVAAQMAKFNDQIDVRLFIGGGNRETEIKKLSNSNPHIVIGTLGRIYDLAVKSNALKIYSAKMVVLDEGDMVISEKELEDVDKVIGIIQENPQFMVFSATMPKGLRNFINRYLEGAKEIVLEETHLAKSSIEQIMIPCKAKQKEDVLLELLNIITPYLALIFVNKKEDVDKLAEFLAKNQFKVTKLHGDLDDRTRKQTLKRIHELKYQYVVASDIASRGIDIEGVSHVINFDLPKDVEFYVHRVGRTARYNNTGVAYSLYTYDTEEYVKALSKKGLNATFKKIVKGEFVETNLKPQKPKSYINQKEQELHQKYRLDKKVKPGYKKKRMELINKELKKARREHIESIYRKKAKNAARKSR